VGEGPGSAARDCPDVMGISCSSETVSARRRSSHFPRIASILPPMRWEGVHRRVVLDEVDEVLPVERELRVETEPDLESDPACEDPRSRRRA
jgi:hypothetical protein